MALSVERQFGDTKINAGGKWLQLIPRIRAQRSGTHTGFDSFVTPGVYNLQGVSLTITPTNGTAATSAYWILEVVDNNYNGGDGSYLLQRATSYNNNIAGIEFQRLRISATGWGAWQRVSFEGVNPPAMTAAEAAAGSVTAARAISPKVLSDAIKTLAQTIVEGETTISGGLTPFTRNDNVTVHSGVTTAAATSGTVTFADEFDGVPAVTLTQLGSVASADLRVTAVSAVSFTWSASASVKIQWTAVFDDS